MVYPTSIHDRATITFTFASTGNCTLEVYDTKGALVKRIAAGAAEAGNAMSTTSL